MAQTKKKKSVTKKSSSKPSGKKASAKNAAAKNATAKKKSAAPKANTASKKTQSSKATPKSESKLSVVSKLAGKIKSAVASTFSSNKNLLSPLEDRVLVQPDAAPEQTESGLIIPGSAAERPERGTVLAKGPGRRNKKGILRPLDVNVGDKVYFPKFAGQMVAMEGDEFLILREDEILAISVS